MEQTTDEHAPLEPAEPILGHEEELSRPAIDTFTDDTIGHRPSQTCSELGSQRIRLARILPGPPNSIIRLQIKICFLSGAGEYTALSYTWGSTILQRAILVEEQPRDITTNLWRFLSHARQLPARLSGWLWIDALSIKQTDPWERLEQVKIIAQIFRLATKTVIWLGPAYGDSNKAMEVLNTTSPSASDGMTSPSLWETPGGLAIWKLCERAYWRRLWVLQELKTSRALDLMCGDRRVSFWRFANFLAVNRVDARVQKMVQSLQHTSAGNMIKMSISPSMSLYSMLCLTRDLHCANPRDKVYAILSVVTSGHNGIEADYTATLPELLNKVLRNMHDSESPSSPSQVFKICLYLEYMFEQEDGSMFRVDIAAWKVSRLARLRYDVFHGLDASGSQTSKDVFGELQRWCEQFGHERISRMLEEHSSKAVNRKQHKEMTPLNGELDRLSRADIDPLFMNPLMQLHFDILEREKERHSK